LVPQEPYISAKERSKRNKEPYISAKRPHVSAKEPCISAKEPYIFAKETLLGSCVSLPKEYLGLMYIFRLLCIMYMVCRVG